MHYIDSNGYKFIIAKNWFDFNENVKKYKYHVYCSSPYMSLNNKGLYITKKQAEKALQNYIKKDIKKVEKTLQRLLKQTKVN